MIHSGWRAFGSGSLLSGFLFDLAQDASELLCQWTVNSFNYWPNPKNVNKWSSILNTEHNTLKNQLYFYFWVDYCFTFLWHQLSIHSPVSTGVYSWGHVIQWFSNWFSRMFPSGCFWLDGGVGWPGRAWYHQSTSGVTGTSCFEESVLLLKLGWGIRNRNYCLFFTNKKLVPREVRRWARSHQAFSRKSP